MKFVTLPSEGQNDLSTAEILTEKGWKKWFFSLPVKIRDHCLVLANSTTVLMIGGEQNDKRYSSDTYFFNSESEIWVEGPSLEIGREWHSCARIKSDKSSHLETVIVAGGSSNGNWLSTVEVLNQDSRGWKHGPELPFAICCASLIEDSSGGVLLIGGYNGTYLNTLFQLDNAKAQWIEISQKLKVPRSMTTAFLVPDDVTDCTKDN